MSAEAVGGEAGTDMIEEIWALLDASQHAYGSGDRAEAREGYARAGQMALEANLPELRARALQHLIELNIHEGRYEQALADTEEVAALYRRIGDVRARAYALRERAKVLGRMERWLDARIAWRDARQASAGLETKAGVLECDRWLEKIDCQLEADLRARRRRAPSELLKPGRGISLRRGPAK